jgi:hypothetical protein
MHVIGLAVPLIIFAIGMRLVMVGNKRGYVLIIFAVVAGVAIAWNSKAQQDYRVAIAVLKQSGFTIDEQLPSTPPVVFDHTQRQIAFIKSEKPFTYSYNAVQHVEWLTTKNKGWTNKSSSEKSYSVIFHLQDGAKFSVTMTKAGETLIKAWQQRLGPPIKL